MDDCIFCKISSGAIPSYTVYEDGDVFAFLDINPVHDGHTLVIPKRHVQFVHELDDSLFQSVMNVTKKVMKAIDSALDPERVGVVIEGFDVAHAHVKVFPLEEPGDITTPHVVETSEEYFESIRTNIVDNLE